MLTIIALEALLHRYEEDEEEGNKGSNNTK